MNPESPSAAPGAENSQKPDQREEPVDVRAIDWNRAWQAQLARRGLRKRDARYWDGRAPSFAKAVSETDFSDRFLAILKPQPSWTVLDMGCGSGALAIPLAKRVRSVTAVDFSGEMLAVLRDQCAAESLANVATIQGSWEQDWGQLGIGACDVAIACRSLVVEDLRAALLKLDAAARKGAYIVTVVGDGPHDRRLFEAVGRPLIPSPDYIYTYNLLYQMGICANVAFIEEIRNRSYDSPEQAAASLRWMVEDLTGPEEAKLGAFLKKQLVFRDGSWRLCYDKEIRWAVIWWEKG